MTKTTMNIKPWLKKVNELRKVYWDERFTYRDYTPLKSKEGKKFIKIINESSVWGFVAMVDGNLGGVPYSTGDLLKPASWRSPAKHSRGNIFEGTDSWTYHGPTYLK